MSGRNYAEDIGKIKYQNTGNLLNKSIYRNHKKFLG
jgi:hypothetical protein